MHGYRRIVAVLALVVLMGGGGYILWRDYVPVDTEVDCGQEDAPFGQPAPLAQRDCLWQAYQAGNTARLVLNDTNPRTAHRTTVSLASGSRIRVTWEATGAQGTHSRSRTTCAEMDRSWEYPTSYDFRLRECGSFGDLAEAGYMGGVSALHD